MSEFLKQLDKPWVQVKQGSDKQCFCEMGKS